MIMDREIAYHKLTDHERQKLKTAEYQELTTVIINGFGPTYVLLETINHKFIRIKDKMK